jgi:ATP-dependent helicase HrpB
LSIPDPLFSEQIDFPAGVPQLFPRHISDESISRKMNPLPIDSALPDILSQLRAHRSLVLIAPPGAGKTTRVPPAMIRGGLLTAEHPSVVLLQPRRIAARASAARIAEENGWRIGEEVGYHIRFERRLGPNTQIRVVTEGILTRQLVRDPFLDGVGAIILDEFHERNLHSDLALAFLREIRETVRQDVMIVVMSATLDPAPLSRYLSECPVVRIEGRSFPVELEYIPPTGRVPLPEQVASAVRSVLRSDSRDILVFLPGAEEIRRCARILEPLAECENLLVLPLHGTLRAEEQDRALRPASKRKIVLATNVAETSLTIDGIGTVIDSGLARFASHDSVRGLDRLELGRISRSSAAQRAGRAGRTGPGRCVRLWSARDERGMPESDVAEIHRVDLSECLLAIHAWGQTDPSRFQWFDAPPADAIKAAERLLTLLGACASETGQITKLGKRLFGMPLHPRLGRLLIAAADEACLFEGATLAALLAEKDLALAAASGDHRERTSLAAVSSSSDLFVRMDWLDEAVHKRFSPALRERGIDPAAARRVVAARDDLVRTARRLAGTHDAPQRHKEFDEEALLKLVLLAYPDRVTRRRAHDRHAGLMVGGRGIRLDLASVVRDSEFFLSLDPREDRRGGPLEARVRIASAIRVEWLEALFPDAIRRERAVKFDSDKGRVVAVETTWYRDLPIREDPHVRVEPEEAAAALAEELREHAAEFVEADKDATSWLTRVWCLRDWMPDGIWPEYGPAELGDILAMASAGKRSLDEVRRVPLVPLFQGMMPAAQARALDELAPETILVPSGSRHRLTYERGRPPILAVRLQELFGWTDTPRIAGGRIPVVLHLLGPNFRPVQITDDLRSFWATTYFQVRKDLRARYPKHAWPENPLEARAEAKGGRRGKAR